MDNKIWNAYCEREGLEGEGQQNVHGSYKRNGCDDILWSLVMVMSQRD
jgi:hypothetical protein